MHRAHRARLRGRAKPPTTDVKAYEAYLQAIEFGERPSVANLRKSLELYQLAIDRDPRFARALTGKAFTLITSVLTGMSKGPAAGEAIAEAARHGQRVIEIDPNLAGTHVFVRCGGIRDSMR